MAPFLAIMAGAGLFLSCSVSSLVSSAMSGGGSGGGALGVFMREDDPEFVAQALPTLIKTLEALLASDPDDKSLNLSVGSAYVMYANAFIEGPASRLDSERFEEKAIAKARALNFYKRGSGFVGSVLEAKSKGCLEDSAKAKALAARLKRQWAPYLYWYAAGACSAFALDPLDVGLSLRMPSVKVFIDRAYELDGAFMDGAIADFLMQYHASVPDALGGDPSKVDFYFQRALELNGGRSAGTYLSYAKSVCVPKQDYPKFKELIGKALAIDVNANPDSRLMNVLSQRNARYALDHADDLFLTTE